MQEQSLDQLLGLDAARSIRDLLEDFERIGFGQYSALIPSCDFDSGLYNNVMAAVLASKLNLSSIDYTKRRYIPELIPDGNTKTIPPVKRYIKAYMQSKYYIKTMLSKTSPAITETPQLGAFGAAVVLIRLQYSFFSAHILYRLGHKYEAHAVSRLILEQIAWAYSAFQLNDLDAVKKLVTTNCIGKLRKLNPAYGQLYGVLSKKVHIDYESHNEFLHIEDGNPTILQSHFDFYEYALVILTLADVFGIVWELSQTAYIQNFEATEVIDGVRSIRADRPFRKIVEGCLAELQNHDEHC